MVIRFIIFLIGKVWKLTRRLFWVALWLFGLAMLFWYPMRWWPGERFRLVQVLTYFMPWFLTGLFPAVLIAGVARRKWLTITLAAPTIFISANFAPLFLPRFSYALASNEPLKVMSYNVLYRNHNLEAAIAIIQQEQPDILLLQEVTPDIATKLDSLHSLYPNDDLHFTYEAQIGQAIISRYPITRLGIAIENGRAQKVQIDTPDGPIAVWNVHPSVPRPWSRQYQQLSGLAQDIAAENGPLIVGGDFNTTYQSETYNLINQYLDNAHWDAGWGFGFTFPAHAPRVKQIPILKPVIRIDHIFHNDHFFAHSARTLSTAGGSDHLPVVAVLSLVK